MYIAVKTSTARVPNPYYSPANSRIEPEYTVDTVKDHRTLKDEELTSAKILELHKDGFTIFKIESKLEPSIKTVVEMQYTPV